MTFSLYEAVVPACRRWKGLKLAKRDFMGKLRINRA
jgi:hypothetical protein